MLPWPPRQHRLSQRQRQPPPSDQPRSQAIRAATAKYHNIATALADGYVPFADLNGVSCIAEPGMGGMGVHFVNPALIQDPAINPDQPEALVYAPDRDGTLRLAALEYLVDKLSWTSTRAPPALFPGSLRRDGARTGSASPTSLATRLGLETQPRRVARQRNALLLSRVTQSASLRMAAIVGSNYERKTAMSLNQSPCIRGRSYS